MNHTSSRGPRPRASLAGRSVNRPTPGVAPAGRPAHQASPRDAQASTAPAPRALPRPTLRPPPAHPFLASTMSKEPQPHPRGRRAGRGTRWPVHPTSLRLTAARERYLGPRPGPIKGFFWPSRAVPFLALARRTAVSVQVGGARQFFNPSGRRSVNRSAPGRLLDVGRRRAHRKASAAGAERPSAPPTAGSTTPESSLFKGLPATGTAASAEACNTAPRRLAARGREAVYRFRPRGAQARLERPFRLCQKLTDKPNGSSSLTLSA
jgi:hypothetical protein